jgi:hypothetical protein
MADASTSPGPSASRWAAIGLVAGFIVGGIVGLIIGLDAHPATAGFAVFELGIPASVLGGFVGLVSGAVAHALDRRHRPRAQSSSDA